MTRSVALAGLLALLPLASCTPNQGTIGAVLSQQSDGRLLVHEAPEGLAAQKGGLLPGDEILLVEGMDVRAMDPKALHAALAGEVGTKVRLTVLRGEEVLRVTLERTPAKRKLVPKLR